MDTKTGRKVETFVKHNKGCYFFTLWADRNNADKIKMVEGVTNVFMVSNGTEYTVFFDPRYNENIIEKNVVNLFPKDSVESPKKKVNKFNTMQSWVFGNWVIRWHGNFDKNFLKLVKFFRVSKIGKKWWAVRIYKLEIEHFSSSK
jgi:hypothetical protein